MQYCIVACIYIYIQLSGGQNYLLLAMDMAKVDLPIGCEGFYTNLNTPSPFPTTLRLLRWMDR